MISGLLVLLVVLWEMCFLRAAVLPAEKLSFFMSTHMMMTALVWFNSAVVLIHSVFYFRKHAYIPRFIIWQLVVGLLSSLLFANGVGNMIQREFTYHSYWLSVFVGFVIGIFSMVNIGSFVRQSREGRVKTHASSWSPAVIFFSSMLAFVIVSTLLLLTPGATYKPVSVVDAFFITSSATASTGLSTVDIASTYTAMGKMVILMDIQLGGVGVMTFTYFVMLMMGKRLAVKDRTTLSGILDQQGVSIVPSLIKSVIAVTFVVELIGAIFLYFSWKDLPGMPQDNLWANAVFHSVSAFCNAGLSLFPNNMAEPCVAYAKMGQSIMMLVTLAGTMGFGFYLEVGQRLRCRFNKKRPPLRWSTHCWLVTRVTFIVVVGGWLILSLLGILEPSARQETEIWYNISWEALWNTIGRSTGFNISDLDDYGPAYKLFLCVLMFIGGNPAGTGGGVFAVVVALCVLEIVRVLRGANDLELHQRRIARATISRAMATVVLSIVWIVFMTMILCLLDPVIANQKHGFMSILFEEVSAYTTTGYSLGISSSLSDASKWLLSFNMLFGRVGMFTFMMIFVRQRDPKLLRFPETRLPLT